MATPMGPKLVTDPGGYGLFSDKADGGDFGEYGWIEFKPFGSRSFLAIRVEGGAQYAQFTGVDELRALATAILNELGTG